MSKSNTMKRLDGIEQRLTPKEWGVRFADAVAMHPSLDAFLKPYIAAGRPLQCTAAERLNEQAEDQHPGTKATEALRHEVKKLQIDFETLKLLVLDVNADAQQWVRETTQAVALQLRDLQGLLLEDGFRLAAERASAWIRTQKDNAGGAGEEEARRVVLEELQGYAQTDETSNIAPPHRWVSAATALARDLDSLRSAIVVLQDAYFAGHRILARNTETALDELITRLRKAVEHYNDHVCLPRTPSTWAAIAHEELAASPERTRALADEWIRCALEKATLTVLEWLGDTAGYAAYSRKIAV
jgi:hypothetical protein